MFTRSFRLILAGLFLLAPALASAQLNAGLTGAARDTTGGVLPGVTVEASSPALIEGTRVGITDGQGRYNIIDLRPGVYDVTFTLPGFSTFVRQGLDLSAGFTATINADMAVGGVEETITVTGATPVVDVQNTRTQAELDYDTIEALPSGSRDLTAYVALTLGATGSTAGRNDVGGNLAESNTGISIHGSRGDDGRINYNGMNTNVFYGGGGGQQRVWKFNTIGVQETVIDTGGANAESETGGANVDMIPRDGANSFSLHSIAAYTHEDLVSSSVAQEISDRAMLFSNLTGSDNEDYRSVKQAWDYGVGVGGPLARDRVWFYAASRAWGGQNYAPNNFFNQNDDQSDGYGYVPDLERRAYGDFWQRDVGIRITWQAASQHKIATNLNWQRACGCWLGISLGQAQAPETNTDYQYGSENGGMYLSQTSWTFTPSSRVLIEAAGSFLFQHVAFDNYRHLDNDPTSPIRSITNVSTSYSWGAMVGGVQGGSYDLPHFGDNFTQRASISYVTGSHNAKFGIQALQGRYDIHGDARPNGVNYRVMGSNANPTPFELTQFASPFENHARVRGIGLYAQDQWTIDRLTVNAGVRFDYGTAYALAIDLPAGPFVGPRSYPELRDLPNYRDITPRVGVSYDLSGDGRTAIKASWGRYLIGVGGGDARDASPAVTVVSSTRRFWNDANGDWTPNCDLTSPAANGECGPWQTPNLGGPATAGSWSESARTGWGVRPFSYQTSVALQHELVPGFGINIAYHRNDFKNHQAVINNAVTADDYGSYMLTVPDDARLGEYAGATVGPFYDINPDKLGAQDYERVRVEDIEGRSGDPMEVFNGLDISMNARFNNGATLLGGVAFGRTAVDYCWLNDLPHVVQLGMTGVPQGRNSESVSTRMARSPSHCRIVPGLWDGQGSQIKIQGIYPLPWDMAISGSYKHLPGIPLQANYNARNFNALLGGLGRPLSACVQAGNPGPACPVTVPAAILPIGGGDGGTLAGQLYDDRINQVDTRFSKGFQAGGARFQAVVELYNVFNSRPAQFNLSTYDEATGGFFGQDGFLWDTPFQVLGGRTLKFGAQIDF